MIDLTQAQSTFLFAFLAVNALIFSKAWYEVRFKNNPFGLTPWLLPLGIFVWGDAMIFGLFWAFSAVLAWVLKDWYLFWLIFSVFWVVRGLGETVYWLNQQFSTIDRNPFQKILGGKFFNNDSIWFVYQIIWQCVMVFGTIASIYVGRLWILSLS